MTDERIGLSTDDTDRVVLDLDEARRIANSLEYLYYETRENAYEATDEQAARDAMMIRGRGGIEPNPQLLDSNSDTETSQRGDSGR